MKQNNVNKDDTIIEPHGGYRGLLSFQLAQLVSDLTVRFVERYVDPYSRTKDQMIQAARSGVQNIAEGSQASATSRKSEMRLTNVARASLEELKLDYEDYLRQKQLPILESSHPILVRLKKLRCKSVEQFREWVKQERSFAQKEHGHSQTGTDKHNSGKTGDSPCPSVQVSVLSSDILAANGILSLLNLACWLLDKQLLAQAEKFKTEGGFTEKLYRVRRNNR